MSPDFQPRQRTPFERFLACSADSRLNLNRLCCVAASVFVCACVRRSGTGSTIVVVLALLIILLEL
jgi:hypothetical protein